MYNQQMRHNPGRDNVLIEIYDRKELEEVQIETGEYVQKHKKIGKAWVEIINSSGREFLEYRKDENDVTNRIRLRYIDNVEVNDYIIMDGERWDIEYISPPNSRYMEMVIKWRS